MKPAPAIPEEAREHFVMATAFQKEAKDKRGYELAIKEYKDALLIAPWWPDAYSNLGILQKLAGQYDEAIQTLNLYLLTNPADARNAQDEIYKIKAAKKIAESEQIAKTSSAPSADKPKSDMDVSGHWKVVQGGGARCAAFMHTEFSLNGDNLVQEIVVVESYPGIEGCGDISIRGQRHRIGIYFRSGKSEFKYTDFAGVPHKIEFVGDTAFETIVYTDATDNRVLRRQR
jgi:tetratricopeptide (TPR) repeat protein